MLLIAPLDVSVEANGMLSTVHICIATDVNGNVSSAAQSVTATDSTAPAITPPADLTVTPTGVLTSVTVGLATATDIKDVVSITSNATSWLPVGITIVIWTTLE